MVVQSLLIGLTTAQQVPRSSLFHNLLTTMGEDGMLPERSQSEAPERAIREISIEPDRETGARPAFDRLDKKGPILSILGGCREPGTT
jgi:hypothetical protein